LLGILQADNVHTGNLFNIKDCEKILFSLDKSERLPSRNTLETLMLLRRCWLLIDVFKWYAQLYKLISKLSYFIMLVMGTFIVTVTAMSSMFPGWTTTENEQIILLSISLSMGVIQGILAIVEPSRKWLQLQGGALGLESKIWLFRARVGEFKGSALSTLGRHGAEHIAEQRLLACLTAVQDKVSQSSGLKKTGFYAVHTATDDVAIEGPGGDVNSLDHDRTINGPKGMKSSFRLHGQFMVGRFVEGPPLSCDNHHSPATPQEYIQWRLMPALQFYQRRIPQYARRRMFFQASLMISSVINALLASFGEPSWTAIVASVAGGFAAWQEFVCVEKKLERQSTVASALEHTLVWWQALTEVDQASINNVEHLVQHTEELLTSDLTAWLSDAQQQMQKGQSTETGNETGNETDNSPQDVVVKA